MELTAGRKTLSMGKIHRGIFQGDALSLLLICNFNDVTQLYTEDTRGNNFAKSQKKKKKIYNFYSWTTSNCLQKYEKEMEILIRI